MQYVKKWIADSEYTFLEIAIHDLQDIEDISNYTHVKNVIVNLENIKFLESFKEIEKLIITSGMPFENMHDVLGKMTALKMLKIDYEETLANTDWCINISVFPKLEYLCARSSYNFCGISSSKSLKTLEVMKWYERDLIRLKKTSIDSLRIFSGKLQTLNGIENSSVQILSLSNLRFLTDISSAEGIPLKILELENCNQIPSLETFSSDTLEYLMVYGKNKVSNTNFISKLKSLKRIMFDIEIENGDLSPLDNLEHSVILTDKRKYNRINSKLPKSKERYAIKTIPEWRYIYSNRNI
ncbi:MAG: hypothetical protein IJN93_04670 [Clostridia bacterium]|nr:hypothetical protein [Clostridia bacterium]